MRSARHLAHFVAIGALLFAAHRRFAPPPPVVVPAARVAERAAGFARESGSVPDARVRALLERDALDEALLAREARRLGLDRDDAVVRERLVSNVAFTGDEAAPDERYREALALGMDQSDALVRRRLAARMRDRFRAEAARAPIDDATLRAWFAAHRDGYEEPPAVRLTQLCFSGPGAERRARAALPLLLRAPADAAVIARSGDPCLQGSEVPLHSEAELAGGWGAGFARAVFAARVGVWTGPIASSQGWHLVRLRERSPARSARFDVVREAVRDACVAERQDAALREGVARLRAAYAAETRP